METRRQGGDDEGPHRHPRGPGITGEMAFEPGGFHVMLFDLVEPLAVGGTISLTLRFEEVGEVQVDAEVRPFVEDEMGDDMDMDSGERRGCSGAPLDGDRRLALHPAHRDRNRRQMTKGGYMATDLRVRRGPPRSPRRAR